MDKFDVYKDLAVRTNGDVYIGVVGPVRTGKSTFITKFTEEIVIPNLSGKNKKQIAVDEMPQSGSGKTVTTTEPKFVPSEAVKITLKGKMQARIRLIDCVGYMVDGAQGDRDENGDRMVKTPWSKEPLPFKQAGEIGTEKVISEHSTIGILVTTDGSILDIPRESYEVAEKRAVDKLNECGKPFVIVLNTKNPESDGAKKLCEDLSDKYGVKTVAMDVLNASAENLTEVIKNVLFEFPMKSFDIDLPKWMRVLPADTGLVANVIAAVKEIAPSVEKMKHYGLIEGALNGVEGVKTVEEKATDMASGAATFSVTPNDGAFYSLISELSGEEISDEFKLMSYVKDLNVAKQNYKKLKDALFEADENGYGVVVPDKTEMTLEEPAVVKQGGRYGVKLKAKASCMHLIKINLDADVTPISGTEKQCADFAEFLKNEYSENPEKVWKTNVFGKPLSTLVLEEIASKVGSMKEETKAKMRKTVTRIVNEGRGGVICILL